MQPRPVIPANIALLRANLRPATVQPPAPVISNDVVRTRSAEIASIFESRYRNLIDRVCTNENKVYVESLSNQLMPIVHRSRLSLESASSLLQEATVFLESNQITENDAFLQYINWPSNPLSVLKLALRLHSSSENNLSNLETLIRETKVASSATSTSTIPIKSLEKLDFTAKKCIEHPIRLRVHGIHDIDDTMNIPECYDEYLIANWTHYQLRGMELLRSYVKLQLKGIHEASLKLSTVRNRTFDANTLISRIQNTCKLLLTFHSECKQAYPVSCTSVPNLTTDEAIFQAFQLLEENTQETLRTISSITPITSIVIDTVIQMCSVFSSLSISDPLVASTVLESSVPSSSTTASTALSSSDTKDPMVVKFETMLDIIRTTTGERIAMIA